MFQPPPAPEEELEENLRETIEQEMRRSAPDLVLTCAGVGSHIDHLLTRHAVLSATKEAAPQILLWEDLPYAGNPHERTSYPTESPSPYYADDVAWERKLHAVSCYTSQIGMLWPKGDWVEFLTQHAGRYASNKGQLAEVFWQYGG